MENKVFVFDMNGVVFSYINRRHSFFTDMIQKLYKWIKDNKAADVYFVFDSNGSKWRKDIYPKYKENRKERKEESKDKYDFLYAQLDIVREFLDNKGEKVLKIDGVEGDDLMAYVALNEKKCVIFSEDYDLLQLPAIQYSMRKKKYLDLWEIYNCDSRTFTLAKAMAGDSGDNIEGIYGIGLKTAINLIDKFANLSKTDTGYDLDEFFDRLRKNNKGIRIGRVLESRDIIERNLKLVDLITYNKEILEDYLVSLNSIIER